MGLHVLCAQLEHIKIEQDKLRVNHVQLARLVRQEYVALQQLVAVLICMKTQQVVHVCQVSQNKLELLVVDLHHPGLLTHLHGLGCGL
jgi:hypothetical protein